MMEKVRTRLKRAHAVVWAGKNLPLLARWGAVMAVGLVLIVHQHQREGSIANSVVLMTANDAVGEKVQVAKDDAKNDQVEEEDDRLPDAVPMESQLSFLDSLVKSGGGETVYQNYQLFKDMLTWWNPEASNWAQRASVEYRKRMLRREGEDEGRGDLWGEGERKMRHRESTMERCGCKRIVNSTLGEGDQVAEDDRKGSMCSREAADRGTQQRVSLSHQHHSR